MLFSKTMALRRSIARFPQGNQKNTAHETGNASGVFDGDSMTTATGTAQNPACHGANGAAMPTDEGDQDGHFLFNHPERGDCPAA